MEVKKNDFIEIEFTARVKGGEIFDTNIKADAEKAGFEVKNMSPYILAVGKEMVLKSFDSDLEGKEIGKNYSIELQPDQAFGKRNPEFVKMIPMNAFKEQNIIPQRGMQFNIDGQVVRIASVSGGRVLVDFNNPLAGKVVNYNYKILRKVEDQKEQIDAVQDFIFRRKFEYTIKDKEIIFKVPDKMDKFVEMVSKAFEDILGLKAKAEVVKEEPSKKDSAEPKEEVKK
ncbi:peptidylprolyl isomerase [archaeon]|nr:peptidylprolyl isomerase [archaeon]